GHCEAQLQYGKCVKKGNGTQADSTQACEYFRQAANQGNAEASYELARCELVGDGTPQNVPQAVSRLETCARDGDKKAEKTLETFYLTSPEAFQTVPEKTVKWLRVASKNGNKKAETVLKEHFLGKSEEDIPDEAVDWLEDEAQHENADAQLRLAKLYWNDARRAGDVYNWLKAAAKKGDGTPEAVYLLGRCWYEGKGVRKNLSNAQKYLEIAANKGVKPAKDLLAELISDQLLAAAETNDPQAQCDYGGKLLRGEGVPEDRAEAFLWFRRAAEQHYAEGEYMLGLCYLNGWGTDKQIALATDYFRRAARQNHEDAKRKLQEIRAEEK
ncbi:MAG: tetratricopeptide repeat protein, partial [Planctomycetia bacterium]|nr:tetratricopeptide repeat protein [Planctomycetia bacterium]